MTVQTWPVAAPGIAAPGLETQRWMSARLNVRYLRGLRLVSLQVMCAAGLPLWARAHGLAVWGWVCWLAFLVAGTSLALAVSYALLERWWVRRAEDRAPVTRLRVRVASRWEEARAGLWCALAVVSIPPWAAGFVRGRGSREPGLLHPTGG